MSQTPPQLVSSAPASYSLTSVITPSELAKAPVLEEQYVTICIPIVNQTPTINIGEAIEVANETNVGAKITKEKEYFFQMKKNPEHPRFYFRFKVKDGIVEFQLLPGPEESPTPNYDNEKAVFCVYLRQKGKFADLKAMFTYAIRLFFRIFHPMQKPEAEPFTIDY